MRLIEILGAGCPRCSHLETATREAVFRSGQPAEIRRITDFAEISARGLMALPGLMIDGRAVCAGRIPTVAEIEAWLHEDAADAGNPAGGARTSSRDWELARR